jgi:hypothetical protein
MGNVNTEHKDYIKQKPIWVICADATGPMLADADRSKYILQPNPTDKSKENRERYKQYKARAVWYGFTTRTVAGMTGAAFRKPPQVSLPAGLDYALNNVDGEGVGLIQQSASTLASVIKTGRHALFVDHPKTDGETSRADMLANAIRPFIRSLGALEIRNWRTETVGGITKLSMIVLHEIVAEPDDFGDADIEQYRVLRLTNSVYTVETWRKAPNTNDWLIYEQPFAPLKSNGKPFSEIPLYFIGSTNNDAKVDDSPIFDLAQLNIAHFRNSADYEDAAYLVGQPQLCLAGLDEQWVTMLEKKGVYLGARSALPLPAGGSATLLQAAPNTMIFEAMAQKEKQAVSLGARLVEQGGAVKTATQAAGEQNVQHSVLSLCVSNTNEAYNKALAAMGEYAGEPGKSEFAINDEFVEFKLDAQMLAALIAAWQSGKFPETDLWANLRKYGLIDESKSDEDIKSELEAAVPAGPSLDDTSAE